VNATLARGLYYSAQALRGEPVARVGRELEKSQLLRAEQLAALQRMRISVLLRYAYENVPYYHEKWSKAGFSAGDWEASDAFAALPVLEKREVQEYAREMRAPRRGGALLAKTSGSAGTPVSVLRSHESWAHAHANEARAMRWHGVDVGERQAYFWGLALDKKGRREAWLKDWFFNRDRCSAFGLDGPRAQAFYRRLRRRPAAFALGYPAAVAEFADELRLIGLDGRALGWRKVFATAEMLHEHQRTLIRNTFGCAVVNLYGCAEAGVLGMECEHGGMHVPIESVALQWEERGDDDAAHQVLVTDLFNRAQPLVRYRVGDLVERANGGCACGRPLPLIGAVTGRAGDTLLLPDGRRINGHLLGYVFKHHAIAGTVRDYQFLQFQDKRVELLIRPGPGFGEHTAKEIADEVRQVLGFDVGLKLRERLERSGRGKHRDFVRVEDRQ